MKIFLIDKYGKNFDLAKALNEQGISNIDFRDDTNFKSTKNDTVVLIDDSKFDNISKTSKIILITQNKDQKYVWNFVNSYNCVDIIDENLDKEYIARRIASRIKSIATQQL